MGSEPNIEGSYFVPVAFESEYTEFALVLIGYDEDRAWPLGSAVFLAPNLIMTAKHVTDEAWRCSGRNRKAMIGTCTGFAMVANHMPGEKDELATWQCKGMWASLYTDIAFISVEPSNETARRYTPVRTPKSGVFPPTVGEYVFGIGYPNTRILERREDKTQIAIAPYVTRGRVTQVYPVLRDRGMLSFPCFEVNTVFAGGMSGGPLFNERGHLCGLICANRNGEPTSWGATLWPALSTVITHTPDGAAIDKPFPVWALGAAGRIEMFGYKEIQNRIYEDVDPNGRRSLLIRPESEQS